MATIIFRQLNDPSQRKKYRDINKSYKNRGILLIISITFNILTTLLATYLYFKFL